MIDFYSVSEDKLPLSMVGIRKELQRRGYKASMVYVDSSYLLLTRSDGKKLRIYSSMPLTTNAVAASMADDKYATYSFLKSIDIPQPRTMLYKGDDFHEAMSLMEELGRVVVKPVDGGHGDGVTVNVMNRDEFERAIDLAMNSNRSAKSVIVQEQVNIFEQDISVLCIGYKFTAALHRIPARVTGDGEHMVGELINIENDTIRGERYIAKMARINRERAERFLGNDINKVPALGEKFRVMDIANNGQGGEYADITSELPVELEKIAEKIAKAMELPVIGVDIMDNRVIEVNKCPSLYIHDNPTIGKSHDATKLYVDYLDTI
jgi:cyanophycin synthetase